MAWKGVVWKGVAWKGVVWNGVAWEGVAWKVVIWKGVGWKGVGWKGIVSGRAAGLVVVHRGSAITSLIRQAAHRPNMASGRGGGASGLRYHLPNKPSCSPP